MIIIKYYHNLISFNNKILNLIYLNTNNSLVIIYKFMENEKCPPPTYKTLINY